ncbi:methyltetrahydrofolate--corrinoid methyltransferase [Moorella thermoacetica]|uniref:Methionine synthase I, cobalamin-binding domain n=2 Tax=Neomoorella thermoacetica TaxID=1525 RepID=A0A0S6UDB8_NEOTH|nr:methyltetrahydrofolate cobalamin methyltransferase [Moorella thermoacetica]AKX96620.1 5-methyltetrahydrofolate:corrinoid/iron-sulfur protein co-methyltransferase [Moorella thermoacetica]OIQ12883.1 5-methyltetrahydrofolate:corrinoid/iron-sulfur protein co-methyltransferase [Moorella thermoacetica]OIQ57790.1 5-methyltetrahydrofolate:corrinoid/iron-sulfur protein co-methyltransferase [Moorella thermoacetica]QDA00434.1 5-methyltetrahydrofolate:corrinoid/iron-sulfur protein co-methyltransferase [
MLIVGELINTSRKPIKEAIEREDAAYIRDIAVKQAEAGADYIDINCGTLIHNEPEIMAWLVNTVREVVDVPLCIDSPDPRVLETGLKLATRGRPMLNSITAEPDRFEAVLPLAKRFNARVVALCMDNDGIPSTAEKRIEIVRKLVENLTAAGVERGDIYIDPLVKPLSISDQAGLEVLEAVGFIRQAYPDVHIICGLSNVSFGLPNRRILNQVFMVQLMTAGMDSYILDPLDREMMGFYHASRALLGKDPFCAGYLKAHRSGLYRRD